MKALFITYLLVTTYSNSIGITMLRCSKNNILKTIKDKGYVLKNISYSQEQKDKIRNILFLLIPGYFLVKGLKAFKTPENYVYGLKSDNRLAVDDTEEVDDYQTDSIYKPVQLDMNEDNFVYQAKRNNETDYSVNQNKDATIDDLARYVENLDYNELKDIQNSINVLALAKKNNNKVE